MTDIGKEILGSINRLNEVYRRGLGSSTCGNPVLVGGERRDADRTEAEARAERKFPRKVRCYQGEVYGDDPFERRRFNRSLDLEWEPAKRELIRVIEDLQLANPPKAMQALKDYLSDFEGDFINVDPRKENK